MNDIRSINELVRLESAFVDSILAEAGRRVVGQRYMLERLLIGILTGGHVLLEGVPGLAKTLTVKTLAESIDATFRRIQFTPDLLPADVIGTLIYNQKSADFEVRRGPVFANIVLADEINRAPAKVQSALLEAMQEQQVTIGDSTYPLPNPFFVLATQNPVEQEGTYPLPEAQVDRFMLHVLVGYPTREEEKRVMERMTKLALGAHLGKQRSGNELAIQAVTSTEQVLKARETIAHVIVDDKINDYILDVVVATRDPKKAGLKDLAGMVAHGASPRASIALNLAARAHAFVRHRGYVTPEDVKAVGPDVLRHRIILTYEAEAEEITSDQVVRRIFDKVEVP
jgi:MoxR-like ATPase